MTSAERAVGREWCPCGVHVPRGTIDDYCPNLLGQLLSVRECFVEMTGDVYTRTEALAFMSLWPILPKGRSDLVADLAWSGKCRIWHRAVPLASPRHMRVFVGQEHALRNLRKALAHDWVLARKEILTRERRERLIEWLAKLRAVQFDPARISGITISVMIGKLKRRLRERDLAQIVRSLTGWAVKSVVRIAAVKRGLEVQVETGLDGRRMIALRNLAGSFSVRKDA